MKKSIVIITIISLLFYLPIKQLSAQWTPIGPEGGIIRCSTSSHDTIYAVTGWYGSSMYISNDRGDNWTYINSPSLPSNINTILKVGNSLFLGCGASISGSVGIFRSDDNGQTWYLKSNINSSVRGMVAQGNAVFAITSWNGILRSTDNGDHWTDVTSNLPDNNFEGGLIATETAVFVSIGDSYKVWKSINSGDTWMQASAGIEDYATITTMAIVGADIYAGTDNFGIYKSSDEGKNWISVDQTTTANYYNYIAIAGDSEAIFAATYRDGILRSTDQGATWSLSNNGIDIYDQPRTLFTTEGDFFLGTKGGIYKTTDHGVSWSESNSGIYAHMSALPAVVSLDSNLFTAARFGSGVFKSVDNGTNWTNVSGQLPVNEEDLTSFNGNSSAIFAYDQLSNDLGNSWQPTNSPGAMGSLPWIEHNGNLFTVNQNPESSGVFRSLDNGLTWTSIKNGINPSTLQFYTLNTDGSTLLLGTSSGGYYSNDNGDSWSLCTFPSELGYYPLVFQSFVSTNTAYYCGFGGWGGIAGIYRSIDGCANWTKVNDLIVTKLEVADGNIYASGTIKEYINNQDVWVPYLYMSSNGTEWSCFSNDLGTAIQPLTMTLQGEHVFVAKTSLPDYGLFFTSDNGAHWTNASDGMPNHTIITSLTVLDNYLYAGTFANSLWRTSLNAFDIPAQPDAIIGEASPCEGSTQTYSVTSVPGVNYNWLFPNDWTITEGATTNMVTVSVGSLTGLIVVTPYTLGGDGPAQYLVATPQSAVVASVTITGNMNDVCVGTQVTFESVVSGGGNNPQYQWYVNDVAVATGSAYNYIPSDGDLVKVEMMSDLTCAVNNPAISNILAINVIEIPAPPIIHKSGDTLISNYPVGNQWYRDGLLIDGATDDTLKVLTAGTYFSIVTIGECPSDPSNSITASPLAIERPDELSYEFYPVPNNGQFNISMNWPAEEQVSLQIFDALGMQIFESIMSSSNGLVHQTIDLRPIEDGIYIARLVAGSKTFVRKILIINN